jgi:tRNA nucleotidyltransferase (CCA-adding enzyme)
MNHPPGVCERHSLIMKIDKRVKQLLSPALQAILQEAGSLASEMGFHAYAVGGMVRDLLLGIHSFDLDIVVEGDGIRFAGSLAARLHATVKSHERFGTATIHFPDLLRVDVATARTEIYECPAALPKVTPGSIRDDMSRRDFTINSLAISLMPEEFGRLLDFFHGVRDLRERHIRVLHGQSFVDDPTRIFRAVRFETRLGFRIVRSTEQLLVGALSRSILSELEDYRIATELRLILEEPDPAGTLKRLEQLGVIDRLKNRPSRKQVLEKQLKKAVHVLQNEEG